MARTDAIVLGAGIVGTSVALHLVKRGLSVALIDRRGPGEETSYGNTGVIVGASVFPTAFPRSLRSEEHTSELQSRSDLVCRLLLEKKKKNDRAGDGQSRPPRQAP